MDQDKKSRSNFPNNLTVVGGQPSGKNPPFFSTNIEKILLRASSDEDFKNSLLRDRDTVLKDPECSLSHSDRMILGTIPLSRLTDMVERLSRQKTSRRNFLKGAAASAAFLVGGTILYPALAQYIDQDIPLTGGCTINVPPTAVPLPPPLSKTLGKEGGKIIYSTGLTIIIPEGTLSENTDISIKVLEFAGLCEENKFFHIDVYQLSPEDIILGKEVEIYFPALDYKGIKGYFSREAVWNSTRKEDIWTSVSRGEVWKTIPVEIKENYYVLLRTKQFGVYTVGYFQ